MTALRIGRTVSAADRFASVSELAGRDGLRCRAAREKRPIQDRSGSFRPDPSDQPGGQARPEPRSAPGCRARHRHSPSDNAVRIGANKRAGRAVKAISGQRDKVLMSAFVEPSFFPCS